MALRRLSGEPEGGETWVETQCKYCWRSESLRRFSLASQSGLILGESRPMFNAYWITRLASASGRQASQASQELGRPITSASPASPLYKLPSSLWGSCSPIPGANPRSILRAILAFAFQQVRQPQAHHLLGFLATPPQWPKLHLQVTTSTRAHATHLGSVPTLQAFTAK